MDTELVWVKSGRATAGRNAVHTNLDYGFMVSEGKTTSTLYRDSMWLGTFSSFAAAAREAERMVNEQRDTM